jgi:hypothetical protein
MAEQQMTGSLVTLRSILIGAACIAGTNILLEGLRHVVELPYSDSLQSMIATGIGVVIWVGIVMRVKR